MEALPVLEWQLNGSCNLLKELIDGSTDAEWTRRPFEGANLVGFTVWHGARTLDWAVQCAVRGEAEVAARPEWSGIAPREWLFGAGVSRDLADGIARRVSRDQLGPYVEAVRQEVLGWIRSESADNLKMAVDLRARHLDRPDYMTKDVWAEIESLDGIPAWQLLSRPSMSHIRVHYGEVRSQLQVLRQPVRRESN